MAKDYRDSIYDLDEPRGRRGLKRKTRWQQQEDHFASSLAAVPKFLPSGLTIEMQEALATRVRIEELTRKIAINDVDLDFYHEREHSPEPIYDTHGKRINTRDLRAKNKLVEERQFWVEVAFTMNPKFKPPVDYSSAPIKKYRKIYIPVEKYPEYNFFGLIIGPRGNTQKKLEKETGCRIAIRGKGSVKEGKLKRDQTTNPGDDDELHVLLTADNDIQLDKATKIIRELLVPMEEGKNEWKRAQLRELALINGTLRDMLWNHPDQGPNFERVNIKCEICGDASHPTVDCTYKGKDVPLPPAKKEAMANEYEKFLSEIGGMEEKQQDVYDEFMAAIGGSGGKPNTEQQPNTNAPTQNVAPWQQQAAPAQAAPWQQQQPPAAAPPPWAPAQPQVAPPPWAGFAPSNLPPWQQQQVPPTNLPPWQQQQPPAQ